MYTSLPIRRGSLASRQADQGSGSQLNLFGAGRARLHDDKSDEDLRRRRKRQNRSDLSKKLRQAIEQKKYKEVDWFKVFINVGGVKFTTYKGTLNNFENTRLGKLNEESPEYDSINGEYFFDRNPHLFQYILDYQRTGTMHVPRSFCAKTVRDELEFWELDDRALASCCRKFFYDAMNDILHFESLEENLKSIPGRLYDVLSDTSTENISVWKGKLWLFLDDARSSLAAKIWSYFYMLLVFISIASIFIGTLPSCRVQNGTIFKRHTMLPSLSLQTILSNNMTKNSSNNKHNPPRSSSSQFLQDVAKENKKIEILLTTQPHDALIFIDLLCMLFFTFEFFIRIYVCPRKLRLFCRASTIFDMLYLLPVWILFLTDAFDSTFWNHTDRITYLLFMQSVMILRVFRIFRLLRHYRGLKILWLAVRASVGELLLLLVFVLFCITIYAGFIYCAELFNNQAYDNILAGMYWALITMTTVGYGDIHPSTWAGSIVASVCALTGIIIIGMPVPIIASNFHAYYGMHIMDDEDLFVPPKPHAKRQSKGIIETDLISNADKTAKKSDNAEAADVLQEGGLSDGKTASSVKNILANCVESTKTSNDQLASDVISDPTSHTSKLGDNKKLLSVRQGISDNLQSRDLSLSTLPSHLVLEEVLESEHIAKVFDKPIPTISISSSALEGNKSHDNDMTVVNL